MFAESYLNQGQQPRWRSPAAIMRVIILPLLLAGLLVSCP